MNNQNNTGAYDLEGVIWHQHSNKLMVKLLELWPDKERLILDLGCGHNFYCTVFDYAGYQTLGIDGAKLRSVDYVLDITEPLNDGAIAEECNVISLEVGEHIPEEKSGAYLDNVTRFKGDVVMSWATPGQAGIGHINCQSNEWVIEKMKNRGYELDFDKTKELRIAVNGCHCSWFINTLMYFKPII